MKTVRQKKNSNFEMLIESHYIRHWIKAFDRQFLQFLQFL
jgi:hypothetical protein